ncbi:acid phosphatase [Rouxiella sp. Mn2063]|uniref:acid phosphatase n=1 Tax=Rouxiella sp. Mn2063 TaxID=3395262 RepID=UPI003BEE265A
MKKRLIFCAAVIAQCVVCSALADDSFLRLDQTPDSLSYLPSPPAAKSEAFKLDKEAYHQGYKLKGSARWKLAASDADLSDANIGKPFSQAFGIDITPENTPITYDILKKLREDSGDLASKLAKEHYMRQRPFMVFNTPTCLPKEEAALRKNGSYPSGHTAIGWSTVLVLSEIRPDRQNELLKRGYDFGQSRVICGAHWKSDVNAGYLVGAAEVARLHADSGFMDELAKAKLEIGKKLPSQTTATLSLTGKTATGQATTEPVTPATAK